MIPKEIAIQLVQLKEKAKSYSSIQRSLDVQEIRDNVDEFKDEVEKINAEITNLYEKTNNILVDGLITNFELETWFQGLKDKSVFLETNPRLIYEEEQRELEKRRKIAEKKAKQELEELEWQKMVEAEKAKKEAEEHKKRLETQRIEKLEEIESKKKFEEEKEKREAEEHQKRLQAQRIDEYREMYLNGHSEDIDKLQKLIEEGLDVNGISDFDGISRIVFLNRSLNFIKILVDAGLHVTEKSVDELWSNYNYRYNETELLDLLINAKNIDPNAIKLVSEIVANQKKVELEHQQLQALKEQAQRIQEFKEMCQYSFGENIYKLKKLIKEGLDINNIKDFDCLQSCISSGKRLPFIQFLVDSGILVKNKHIEYCYANLKNIKNSTAIISILEEAKNIEILAVKNIRKRNEVAIIGTISMVCICIFLLFMPQILNSEIDNFYYILVGITTIISLLMAINFIVDLRKKSKITNTIHLHGNQLPHRKQSEYEIPNAQGILGIAGSVKEFNHKEIKIKKMILWIVVTLISISIIALIYIFFEEIIDFIKILVVFIILISVLAWGMKNKR